MSESHKRPARWGASAAAAAASLAAAAPLLHNAYFTALARGTMSRETFVRTQGQFFFAVGFFSRSLAALTARLPSSEDRAVLMHNLAEEHGWDEAHPAAGFVGSLAHDCTFAAFLERLGVGPAERAQAEAQPAVQAFNLALLGACSMEAPGFAFGALGMIEYLFSGLSAEIGRRVVDLGWIAEAQLVHYRLHAEIDQRHAAELFEAGERWEQGALPSPALARGLRFGRHLLDRLYTDLLQEAT